MKKKYSLAILSGIIISGCSNSNSLLFSDPIMLIPDTKITSTETPVSKASSKDIITSLQKASAGLLYMSESDYPFKSFLWTSQATAPMTNVKILKILNKKPDTIVELRNLDDFFENLVTDDPSYTPEEKETVLKYRNLLKVIKVNMSDVKVYRVGEIEVEVYIVGKNGSDFLGISTISVET